MVLIMATFAFGCGNSNQPSEKKEAQMSQAELSIQKQQFGQTPDGPADLYTLLNPDGIQVKITNYGGIVVSIEAPDRDGKMEEITHGFDSLSTYLSGHPFFGALVGRYGNRIGGASFVLDDNTYTLVANNGENHLHGGTRGFDKYLWDGKEVSRPGAIGLQLQRTSPHMEEGYPGNLSVTVTYWLEEDNTLLIEYEAETDQVTVCNLTNHTYFNLAGKGTILDHEIMINADHYTPVDEGLIPTGEIESVENTPFDFRTAQPIGRRIDSDHPQIQIGGGYDHNFVLNHEDGQGRMKLAATVHDPSSGRFMEVRTMEPGVQFYTANFLNGSHIGRHGTPYIRRSAFCLETQHFPNSPNEPEFPSVKLEPGEIYQTATSYRFTIM